MPLARSAFAISPGFPGRGRICVPQGVILQRSEIGLLTSESASLLEECMTYLTGERECAPSTKLLSGQDVSACNPCELVSRGIAFASGKMRVLPSLTLEEHFRVRLRAVGASARSLSSVVARSKERFSALRSAPATEAGNLSGGQQQALSLALTILGRPVVLVLEEPWLGLSAVAQGELSVVLKQLQEEGACALCLCQDPEDMRGLARCSAEVIVRE